MNRLLLLFVLISCGQNSHVTILEEESSLSPPDTILEPALSVASIKFDEYDTLNSELIFSSSSYSNVGINSYTWSITATPYGGFPTEYVGLLGSATSNSSIFKVPITQSYSSSIEPTVATAPEASFITGIWIFGKLYPFATNIKLGDSVTMPAINADTNLKNELESTLNANSILFDSIIVTWDTAISEFEIEINAIKAPNHGDFTVLLEEKIIDDSTAIESGTAYFEISLDGGGLSRFPGNTFNVNLSITDSKLNSLSARAIFWFSGDSLKAVKIPSPTNSNLYVSAGTINPTIIRSTSGQGIDLTDLDSEFYLSAAPPDSNFDLWGLDADSDLAFEQQLPTGLWPGSFSHEYGMSGVFKGKYSSDDEDWWGLGLGEIFSEYVIEVE